LTKFWHPGDVVTMRRIMLERNKPVGTESLYFCGFTTSNNRDILFGKLSSSGWTPSNIGTIDIESVY